MTPLTPQHLVTPHGPSHSTSPYDTPCSMAPTSHSTSPFGQPLLHGPSHSTSLNGQPMSHVPSHTTSFTHWTPHAPCMHGPSHSKSLSSSPPGQTLPSELRASAWPGMPTGTAPHSLLDPCNHAVHAGMLIKHVSMVIRHTVVGGQRASKPYMAHGMP